MKTIVVLSVALLVSSCQPDPQLSARDEAQPPPAGDGTEDQPLCGTVPVFADDLEVEATLRLDSASPIASGEVAEGELVLRNNSDRVVEIHWGGSWAMASSYDDEGAIASTGGGTRVLRVVELQPGAEVVVPVRTAHQPCDAEDPHSRLEPGQHQFAATVSVDGVLVRSKSVAMEVAA